MNYQRIYDQLIEKARSENRIKLKKDDPNYIYYEKHHIIPKCMNGTNEENNLVLLRAREHYIAHKLLIKIYPKIKGLVYSLRYMMFGKKNKRKLKLSSKDYQYIKELMASTPSPQKGVPSKLKGLTYEKIMGEEKAKSLIEFHSHFWKNNHPKCSGEKNGMFGKSIYDVWLEKYGKDEADKMLIDFKEKCRKNSSGEKNGMFGKKLLGEKNGMFGKKRINNGIENKLVKKEDLQIWLDKGWFIGMLKK
jgi:hypothetical protein